MRTIVSRALAEMAKEQLALDIEDVTVEIGSHTILDSVSIQVRRGEFLAISGPNGAGKTTLLKAALGLVSIKKGRIEVLGGKPGDSKVLYRIGYLPQRISIDKDFPGTVMEVVSSGVWPRLGPLRRFHGEDKRAVAEALRACRLEGLERERVGFLSGGLVQRVFLARALAGFPDLLLLDEPMSGIDLLSQHELRSVLENIHKERSVTIVAVVHEYGPFEGLIDRLVVLAHRLLYDGPAPVHEHEAPGVGTHQHFGVPPYLLSLMRESEVEPH